MASMLPWRQAQAGAIHPGNKSKGASTRVRSPDNQVGSIDDGNPIGYGHLTRRPDRLRDQERIMPRSSAPNLALCNTRGDGEASAGRQPINIV